MKFYNEKEPLYLNTVTCDGGLGAGLLHVRKGIVFPCDETLNNMIYTP